LLPGFPLWSAKIEKKKRREKKGRERPDFEQTTKSRFNLIGAWFLKKKKKKKRGRKGRKGEPELVRAEN